MKKMNKKIKLIVVTLFVLMGLFLIFDYIKEDKDERLLKNSSVTTARLIKKKSGAVKSPKSGIFVYEVNGKEYEFYQAGNYLFMQLGDTVLIEYAKKDPSVARVKDKFYMRKYKYLKKD